MKQSEKIEFDRAESEPMVQIATTIANTPEQNIVATFLKSEAVVKRVANALREYKRVVVTADHASSKLAVLRKKR